jgi:dipeptidyl aminopeptidase/acylaminoacyl peptidase
MLAVTLLLAGCPMAGETGRITNPVGDVGKFVVDGDEIFVVEAGGMKAIAANGGGQRVVFAKLPDNAHVRDVGPRGEFFVFTDADTNLYLGNPATGRLTRIRELDDRTGEVAVSPDGRTVAVVRHADYRTPQATWGASEDDAVYLVDSASFVVQRVPPRSRGWVTRLEWARDGKRLRLGVWEGGTQVLDLESGTRMAAESVPFTAFPRGPVEARECPETGGKLRFAAGDLVLDTPAGASKTVVAREGYEEGLDSDGGAFHSVFFTRSCRAVVFDYQQALWVADIATGVVGRLTSGWNAFPDPSLWAR